MEAPFKDVKANIIRCKMGAYAVEYVDAGGGKLRKRVQTLTEGGGRDERCRSLSMPMRDLRHAQTKQHGNR